MNWFTWKTPAFMILCFAAVLFAQYRSARSLQASNAQLEARVQQTRAHLSDAKIKSDQLRTEFESRHNMASKEDSSTDNGHSAASAHNPFSRDAEDKPNSWLPANPYVDLNKTNLLHLRHVAFDQQEGNYRLSPETVALLGMNTEQQHFVEEIFNRSLSRIHEIEASRFQRSSNHLDRSFEKDGERTTYVIPAYPTEGAAIKNELDQRLAAVLGSERSEYLRRWSKNQIQTPSGQFGQQERIITRVNTINAEGIPETWIYRAGAINDSYGPVSPDHLPPDWRHLADQLLPSK